METLHNKLFITKTEKNCALKSLKLLELHWLWGSNKIEDTLDLKYFDLRKGNYSILLSYIIYLVHIVFDYLEQQYGNKFVESRELETHFCMVWLIGR